MRMRNWLILGLPALALAALGMILVNRGEVEAQEAKSAPELDRVPTNAAIFIHVRVADVLASDMASQIKKGLGKTLETAYKQFEETVGIAMSKIDRFTIYFSQIDMDGEPDVGFIFRTTEPYDAEAIKKFWVDAKRKTDNPNLLPVSGQTFLHLTDAKTFAILNKDVTAEYLQPKKHKDQPLRDAIELARKGQTAVAGINFSQLPAEVFDENNVQFRPFFPLIKDTVGIVKLDLAKDLVATINVACKNADAAVDAKRSWDLLMLLADSGIDFIMKDDRAKKETAFLATFFEEMKSVIKNLKVTTKDSNLQVVGTLKGEAKVAKITEDILKGIGMAQGAAVEASSINNMKQIVLAMHNYADVNNGFPPQAICDKKGKPLLSWRVAILPYIEQENLYKQFKLDEPWDSEHNIKLSKMVVRTYMTPGKKADAKDGAKTPYRVFYNGGALFDQVQQTQFKDILDGTSNTIILIEAAEEVVWSKPDDIE